MPDYCLTVINNFCKALKMTDFFTHGCILENNFDLGAIEILQNRCKNFFSAARDLGPRASPRGPHPLAVCVDLQVSLFQEIKTTVAG